MRKRRERKEAKERKTKHTTREGKKDWIVMRGRGARHLSVECVFVWRTALDHSQKGHQRSDT